MRKEYLILLLFILFILCGLIIFPHNKIHNVPAGTSSIGGSSINGDNSSYTIQEFDISAVDTSVTVYSVADQSDGKSNNDNSSGLAADVLNSIDQSSSRLDSSLSSESDRGLDSDEQYSSVLISQAGTDNSPDTGKDESALENAFIALLLLALLTAAGLLSKLMSDEDNKHIYNDDSRHDDS